MECKDAPSPQEECFLQLFILNYLVLSSEVLILSLNIIGSQKDSNIILILRRFLGPTLRKVDHSSHIVHSVKVYVSVEEVKRMLSHPIYSNSYF
jgi:hypothetical protein